MIIGLICISIGVWIWLKITRKPNGEIDRVVEWYQTQLNDRDYTIKTLETKLVEKNQNRDLDAVILRDAINRETRAKRALEAVLLKCSATREQIDHVLREVEGSQGTIDGD